jgi:hypothetical protein
LRWFFLIPRTYPWKKKKKKKEIFRDSAGNEPPQADQGLLRTHHAVYRPGPRLFD